MDENYSACLFSWRDLKMLHFGQRKSPSAVRCLRSFKFLTVIKILGNSKPIKKKLMMFWIVFDIWAKTKQTKQKLGKSVHFSAWYDNFNFLWLTRINIIHILVKMDRFSHFLFYLLCFCPNVKNNSKHHWFLFVMICFKFSEILLTSQILNFEDKSQLMETFSGQNFNIFEISGLKRASGVIFAHINNLWRTLFYSQPHRLHTANY